MPLSPPLHTHQQVSLGSGKHVIFYCATDPHHGTWSAECKTVVGERATGCPRCFNKGQAAAEAVLRELAFAYESRACSITVTTEFTKPGVTGPRGGLLKADLLLTATNIESRETLSVIVEVDGEGTPMLASCLLDQGWGCD